MNEIIDLAENGISKIVEKHILEVENYSGMYNDGITAGNDPLPHTGMWCEQIYSNNKILNVKLRYYLKTKI